MLKYMLDTNIVIYVLTRRPPALRPVFNQHVGRMCISTMTFAELMHGVEKSAAPERNLRNVEDFASRLEVLPYDTDAAVHYGEIRRIWNAWGRQSESMISISRATPGVTVWSS